VPGEGFEPVEVVVPAHVPEPPGDDRLDEGRPRAHAGTGSWAGSSTGAGEGTGSSSGAISISCSVSGAPISIGASWGLFIGNSRQKLQSDSDGSDDAIWSFRLDVKDGDALRISGFQTIK
jgi:hypothetical protein